MTLAVDWDVKHQYKQTNEIFDDNLCLNAFGMVSDILIMEVTDFLASDFKSHRPISEYHLLLDFYLC